MFLAMHRLKQEQILTKIHHNLNISLLIYFHCKKNMDIIRINDTGNALVESLPFETLFHHHGLPDTDVPIT